MYKLCDNFVVCVRIAHEVFIIKGIKNQIKSYEIPWEISDNFFKTRQIAKCQ